MDPVLLQKQVSDNAEDLRNSLKDFKNWESEMKRKESELCSENHLSLDQSASRTSDLPPVRNKIQKSGKKTKRDEDKKTVKSDASNKISGLDYSSWEKFDVAKACQQLDEDSEESEEDTESEEEDTESQRLREEAMYEKEKGNQFVKNQKWTNAIECYTRAIECYSCDAIFFANRALCYLKISDLKAAEADCTSALNLDITYVKAFHRRAAARTGLGLLEEAKGDLEKVLMFEPKNSVAKAEILKIENKISALQPEKKGVIEQEKKEDNAKTKLQLSQIATSSLQKAETSNEPLLKSTSNALSSEQEKTTSASTSQEYEPQLALHSGESSKDKGVIVYPIHKPPHLRSKKPLKEMQIKIVNEGMPKKPADLSQFMVHTRILEVQTSVSQDQDTIEENVPTLSPNTKTEEATNIQKVFPLTVQDEVDDISNIPPPANTYIDFYVGWNKVHQSIQRRFLYLKQIPAADLRRIFGESLDSAVLSELIETLERSFLPSKEPVYPYLVGISNVKRLSTLSLFMSNADKARLETLLDSCEHLGECTKDEVILIRKKYEL